VATGLALTLFGLGVSSLGGQGYNGIKPPPTGPLLPDALADLPVAGPILFGHDWMVYFSHRDDGGAVVGAEIHPHRPDHPRGRRKP
jgi:ABC-type uncharacterized transport system permease subunit